jgi:hypothetical protein
MKQRFGWTAENWHQREIRLSLVPEHIRDLIPLAERWGITCDVTRHDVAAKATDEELANLARRLQGRHDDIVDFLYSADVGGSESEKAVFQAMLILELEECDGPGIPGLLEWAMRRHQASLTGETRSRLSEAYSQMSRLGFAHLENDLVAARELLGIEE